MSEQVERSRKRPLGRSLHYGIAAITLCLGIAAGPVPAVAWADPTDSESTSGTVVDTRPIPSSPAERTDSAEPVDRAAAEQDDTAVQREADGSGDDGHDPDLDLDLDLALDSIDTEALEADEAPVTDEPLDEVGATPAGPDADLADAEPVTAGQAVTVPPAEPETVAEPANSTADRNELPAEPQRYRDEGDVAAPVLTPAIPVAVQLPTVEDASVAERPAGVAVAERTGTTTSTPDVIAGSTAVEVTAPTPPQPLSPLAELLQLPGRFINAVLQAFDFTSAASEPRSPFSLAPINDLLFAAFREFERLIGLHRTPPPQPAVPALTYTGPTTTPTPTVAQFLNASAAGYGLGTTPGDLVPFTVNGFQVSSTNIFTGMVGKAWVTPQQQVIIAYQGTSGGTHLLVNPFITISQVLADMQIIFTRTTPLAFYDALRFARRVQAEAIEQGYATEDIFVTGHSLGGWEAQYVSQQMGLAGIGFESPGINTVVPGNGADAMFVNIGTFGSPAPYLSTDLPLLQPFMPHYVPAGGSKPHYGPIVMIGDPAAATPLQNAAALWGRGLIGSVIFLVDFLGNFFQYHLPGVQAYHLDVVPDPGVMPWLGTARGPVHTGYGTLTIPQLMLAASDDGILFQP